MGLTKNICKYVLLCLCVCFIEESFAKNSVYFYAPMEAELDGTIASKKIDCNCWIEKALYEKSIDGNNGGVIGYDHDYEKSDNFRDIQSECVFLLLDEQIDVRKPEGHFYMSEDLKKNNKPEKNVEVLQMSNDDPIDSDFNIGDRVHVRGFLYRHFLHCDHSRVLIGIVDLKVIETTEHKQVFHELTNILKSIILKSRALLNNF